MPRPRWMSRPTCPSRRPRPRSHATPSTPAAQHLSAYSTCPRRVLRRLRPRIAPTWLARKTRAAALRPPHPHRLHGRRHRFARRLEMSGARGANRAEDADKVEMSVGWPLSRTRSVHVSVEARDGATPGHRPRDSQMLIHIVGRTLGGQATTSINMSTPLATASNSSLVTMSSRSTSRPSPPMACFRASARGSVSFNPRAPDTVDSTPQGGFDLYAIAQ